MSAEEAGRRAKESAERREREYEEMRRGRREESDFKGVLVFWSPAIALFFALLAVKACE